MVCFTPIGFLVGDGGSPRVIAVLHERRDPSAFQGRL
jgi:hypothetical protein